MQVEDSFGELMSIGEKPLSVTFANISLGREEAAALTVDWDARLQASLEGVAASKANVLLDPFSVGPSATSAIPQGVVENDPTFFGDDYIDEGAEDGYDAIVRAVENVAVVEDEQPAMTFTEEEEEVEEVTGEVKSLQYLRDMDAKIHQNWAAPQHWKIRRVGQTLAVPALLRHANAQSTRKKAEVDNTVDFASALPDLTLLFAKPATATTITLGKAAVSERAGESLLLPEDVHFASKDLLRLFLHPERPIRGTQATLRRPKLIPTTAYPSQPAAEETDVRDGASYWAQQAVPEQPVPAATLDDNYGDDVYGDDFDNDVVPTVVLPQEPQALNYAKRARRVDIQALKESLWQRIEHSLPAASSRKRAGASKDDGLQFATLLPASLDESVSADRKASVAFNFICLLHLANEHDLQLSVSDSTAELKPLLVTRIA